MTFLVSSFSIKVTNVGPQEGYNCEILLILLTLIFAINNNRIIDN